MSYNRSAKTDTEYALDLFHYPHPSMWKKGKKEASSMHMAQGTSPTNNKQQKPSFAMFHSLHLVTWISQVTCKLKKRNHTKQLLAF